MADVNGAVQTYETCRITIVNNGMSDQVIDVFPAKHKSEKIWLNGRRGIERWEAVKRTLNMYAPRGQHVPEPAPWHSDIKQPMLQTLREQDIPSVKLEGHVLEPLPPESTMVEPVKVDVEKVAMEKRMSNLETSLSAIANAVAAIANSKGVNAEVKTEDTSAVATTLFCPEQDCNKPMKNAQALAIHKGRFHKK